MEATQGLSRDVSRTPVCLALGLSRATLHRRDHPRPERTTPRPTPPRALSVVERQTVRDVLHSERFVDKAPADVVQQQRNAVTRQQLSALVEGGF